MKSLKEIRNGEEALTDRLRALFDQYGYTRYKVSKFEKYDLYAKNKSFLICENILTFTDTNGTLMALKPDVTLSIVKNFGNESGETSKVYYSETVYRTSARSEGFREIRQTGLECIGRVDSYLTGEVLMLASESLAAMADSYLLDVSHMGFLTALLSECGVAAGDTDEVLSLMANKNLPGLTAFAQAHGLSADATRALTGVTSVYAPLGEALVFVRAFVTGDVMQAAYDELFALCEVMRAWGREETLYLDFSLACDRNYYNGIVFRGYISGIPEAVLSGGRYDSLLTKMGKKGEAIGFAVYPDLLHALDAVSEPYDTDAVILYDGDTNPVDLILAVREKIAEGLSVRTECASETATRAKAVYRMNGKAAVKI